MLGKSEKDDVKQEALSQFDHAARRPQTGFMAELLSFLLHNKKWWLAPILIALLLIGFLVVLAGSGAAPFVYTLF